MHMHAHACRHMYLSMHTVKREGRGSCRRAQRKIKKNDSEGIRSENKAATLDWGPLTSFSQVLMQISDQTEGNQAPGARGVITARVFLPQSSLELGTQLPGQLLPF